MFTIDESSLDIWSIPHFLSGILIGIPALYYGYSFYESLAIVLVLSIGFEGIEIWFGIKESRSNQIADLILGIIAFVIGYYLYFTMDDKSIRYMMIVSLIIYLLVVIPGWLRYIHKPKVTSK